MKQCTKCLELKPLTDFGINRKVGSTNFRSTTADQYKPYCKPCLAVIAKEWRNANPNYHKNVSGKISKYPKELKPLLSAIRSRVTEAKQNNRRTTREFTIDADYMYELWIQQKGICYLTGFTLLVQKQSPYALSIDKIIPSLGYVKGNVKWCCWMANRAKGDLSMQELLVLCNAIQEKCRDYPAMEYDQVIGSAQPLEME